jgi:Na+-transporting methylmalonyl-CoA/oxaloacetate decarboxylase gamma subunit
MRTAVVFLVLMLLLYVLFSGRGRAVYRAIMSGE